MVTKSIKNGKLSLDKNYYLSANVLLDILLVDILDYAKKIENEIVIFHGNCDDMVPYSTSQKMEKLCKNVKLVTLNKTEHGLTEVGDEEFASMISVQNLATIIAELH